jgi:hypothetical protein
MLARHKVLKAGFRLRSRAFMLTYNNRDFKLEDADEFEALAKAVAKKFKASAWAACWEETLHPALKNTGSPSMTPPQTRRVFHGHSYYFWFGGDELCFSNTDAFLFKTVRPRVDQCYVTNPAVFKVAALHGLWYVYVTKLGTQQVAANIFPWQHYTPKKEWLVKLWEDRKLDHASFERLSTSFRGGHAARMKDLEAVRSSERSASILQHIKEEAAPPAALRDFRTFEEVEKFVELFATASGKMFRRPLLAILAPTGFGKSMLARDVLRRVAKLVSAQGFLEVTVEEDGALELSGLDVVRDGGVLLDGVGDASMLSRNREALQGQAKACRGGKSATMMYAYPFTLARRAVVATFDLSAKNLSWFRTHHWLSAPGNVVVLRLTSPAWVPSATDPPHPTPPTVRAAMSSWTVEATAVWLESMDAAGPAAVFRANAVTGQDFLAFRCAGDLSSELRMTRFAAMKVLQLRDA